MRGAVSLGSLLGIGMSGMPGRSTESEDDSAADSECVLVAECPPWSSAGAWVWPFLLPPPSLPALEPFGFYPVSHVGGTMAVGGHTGRGLPIAIDATTVAANSL